MTVPNKKIHNQAMGLFPLLLFVLCSNFVSYAVSLSLSVATGLALLYVIRIKKNSVAVWMQLMPAFFTLLFYTLFMLFPLGENLYAYTPVIIESLLIFALFFVEIVQGFVKKYVWNTEQSPFAKTYKRATINEHYFISRIIQCVYMFHLSFVLIYELLPEEMANPVLGNFLLNDSFIVLGIVCISYEEIRLNLLQRKLAKETWLPIVNGNGRVIGFVARSVSRLYPAKYCHPVVRVALVYQGKLLLAKREKTKILFPDLIDVPIYKYVLFHETIEDTLSRILRGIRNAGSLSFGTPISYHYKDGSVNQRVSLYIINCRTEEQLEPFKAPGSKLWTVKQIEENIVSGVFSKMFESEFPYFKSTVLLAENY